MGAFGGSPGFDNGGFFLDFEPSDVGGPNNFDAFIVGDNSTFTGGSYLATSAPEPSSVALLAVGATGGILAIRRRRRG